MGLKFHTYIQINYQMARDKLKFVNLMDELFFVKGRAEAAGLSDYDIKNLRFAKTDNNGQVIGIIDNYKLTLAKFKGETLIVMLTK